MKALPQNSKRYPRKWENIRLRVLARDNRICGICHKPGANSVDHIIPIAKGGTHDMANLRAAHLACNVGKGARTTKPAIPRKSRFD